MNWHKATIEIATRGKALYPITREVETHLRSWEVKEGMLFLYIQHTSASLTISESYDPTAKLDLEAFMERLAPEDQNWYRHTLEGSDDSPSHIRAMLTQTHLAIPVDNGRLNMGTWQGIYLFEHRRGPEHRRILVRCLSTVG